MFACPAGRLTAIVISLMMSASVFASAYQLTGLTEDAKLEKVIVVDHPELFEVVFAGASIFLPETIHHSYYQSKGLYGQKFPVYKAIEDLIGPELEGNWKFVIVENGKYGLTMRIGNKETFGKKPLDEKKQAQANKKKQKKKSLHHPTLAVLGSVVTAGVISWDQELAAMVIDIDSGNYGLDVEKLSSFDRDQHIAFLREFFRGYRVPVREDVLTFENVKGTRCLILGDE